MKLGLAIVGALLGVIVAGGGNFFLGITAGALIGLLTAQVQKLACRLKVLEGIQQSMLRDRAKSAERMGTPPEPSEPPEQAARAVAEQEDERDDTDTSSTRVAPQPPTTHQPTLSPHSSYQPSEEKRRLQKTIAAPKLSRGEPVNEEAPTVLPDHLERFFTLLKGWFTTGNVPVKVGVIVSFFGVAFLLKYSIERQLIVLPIELRLLGVGLFAIVLLGFGWRLNKRMPVYGLSLQGGGIGILYLTIFAAFRLYGLMPPLFAFGLLVLLTAGAGALAILQNAKALAVLGIVGGFLAPVLVSTGSGNHVALFSYYLVLNLAILGIARFRAWRELNVLGFVFTFVIGTGWGYRYYRPELFESVEPFLVLHFLLYQAVAVMFALRQPPKLKEVVDGTIVFGTPVVGFALQAALLKDTEYGLAISAVVVGLFYAGLASWLWAKHRARLRLLAESYVGLAVAFGTIAIPLALDARWTAAAWALEGAALVWVGVRQGGLLAKASGSLLVVAAGVSFLNHGWDDGAGWPILNGNFLGGLLIAVSSLAASRFFDAGNEHRSGLDGAATVGLFVWGVLWWLGSGVVEVEDRFSGAHVPAALTLFAALSGLLCALLAGWQRWEMARITTLIHLPLLGIAAIVYANQGLHPFAGWGALAWVAAGLVQLKISWDYEDRSESLVRIVHGAGVLFAAVLLMWEVGWQVDHAGVSDVWGMAASGMVPVSMAVLVMGLRDKVGWPIKHHWNAYFATAGLLAAGGVAFIWLIAVGDPGDPSPLGYVPVFNPFDLATLLALGVAGLWVIRANKEVSWFEGDRRNFIVVSVGLAAFAMTTIAVVRGVHHWVGLSWRADRLFDSVAVQAALSIYWGMLGVGGMVWGARVVNRKTWLVGAGLMGLVVVKLFLIDLGNTETIARIVSFIGVGGLLLVVGYFAPAPPRGGRDNSAGESDDNTGVSEDVS